MQQFPRYKVPRRVPPLQPHYLIEISLGSPRYYQREERERGGGERMEGGSVREELEGGLEGASCMANSTKFCPPLSM